MAKQTIPECPRCEGSGRLQDAYWTCGDPECCGSGDIDCPDCDGTGYTPTPEPTTKEAP